MLIREIKKEDNLKLEKVIRDCLIEQGVNKPGCIWQDDLTHLYEDFNLEGYKYYVIEDNGDILGGCGIGPFYREGMCELMKMYVHPSVRGKGLSKELLDKCEKYASKYYDEIYLETFSSMKAANKFYQNNGYILLDKPLVETDYFAIDHWYIKRLNK